MKLTAALLHGPDEPLTLTRVRLDAMVTEVIPFTEINEGLSDMSDPTTAHIVMGVPTGRA